MRLRDLTPLLAIALSIVVPAAAQQLPPGHPQVAPGATASALPSAAPTASALPAGHPSLDDAPSGDPNPHAKVSGIFDPPPDTEVDDPTLPPSTIAVDLRDADDKPVAGEAVTLGIIRQSVAKGDSRQHRAATSDSTGRVIFSELDPAGATAFRVSVVRDGATFAAMPFSLVQGATKRVTLHVYPVVHDAQQAKIGFEAIIVAELHDDRLQFEEQMRVFNVGKTAWQPTDFVMALPPGFTALTAQQEMSDRGAEAAEGRGAKLKGTFPPGVQAVEFRWQLPWDNEADVTLDIGLPPQTAHVRVLIAASPSMTAEVADMPPAERKLDDRGQSYLVTEQMATHGANPLPRVHLSLHGLPTIGNARWVVTSIASFGVLGGLALALSAARARRKPSRSNAPDGARAELLERYADLERAPGRAGRPSVRRRTPSGRNASLSTQLRGLSPLRCDPAAPPCGQTGRNAVDEGRESAEENSRAHFVPGRAAGGETKTPHARRGSRPRFFGPAASLPDPHRPYRHH